MSFFRSIFSLKRPLSSKVRRPKSRRPVVLRLEYLEERCTPSVMVTRTSDNAMFTTIQAAINDPGTVTGSTLSVSAGTDSENVTINKSVNLIGAGDGSDPASNTIIQSAAANTPVVSVTASGTDSSHRLLIQGVRITGATGSGNSGAGVSISSSTGHVELNGVDVASNAGYGITVNAAGPVTDVAILNSTSEGNADGFRMGTGQDLDGLTISNSVFQNNQYGIEVYAATAGGTYLTNVSVSNTQFLNNVFKGAYFEKLNNATFTNITVTGNGSGASSPAGFDLNLKYGNYSNISFNGATFTNNGTGGASGVGLTIKGRDDAPSYNSNPATVTNVGLTNVSITGSPIDLALGNNVSGVNFSGVSLAGAGTGLVYYVDAADTLNLADTSFASALATYFVNQSANNVTATNATFGGLTGATATLAQNYAIEDKVVHAVDAPGLGLVRVLAGNVFVTPNSFQSPTTTTPSIQRGVNAASSGDTVNVEAGTYVENVTIDKNLTLAGVAGNPTAVVIHPSSGDGVTIAAPAAVVTVQDLEITGANNGLNASVVTTLNLTDLALTGNTAGGTISTVNTVNETPSSGSTPTNVTVTGSSFVSDSNQAVTYTGVANFNVSGGSGSDTFNVTPSSGTTFTVHGNNPTPPASPGDALTVPSGGTLTDTFSPGTGYSGTWAFAGMMPVNFDAIETLAPTADLSISVAGPAAATAGDPNGFNYTLTVTNNGPSDNTGGFTVSDTLPAGETFQAVGSTPGATVNGQTITYTNSTGLANGSMQTFTLHVTVAASVPPGTVLQDSATVTPASGGPIDPNPANNTSSFSSTAAASSSPPPFVSVAFGPGGEVAEVVNFEGVLTQFDAAGAHQLGNGGVRTASVAFGPSGEVLEIVGLNGVLTQFDASGAHQLGGAGVQSASVAFGPGGEVLEVVLVDGSLTQFDAAGAHPLGSSGVQSASVAFGPGGEVLEVVNTAGALTQFDASGAHQLGEAGVRSAGVAFNSTGEVLDIIFTDGTLDRFDAFGVHRLGVVS